jgi:hypothetical protein
LLILTQEGPAMFDFHDTAKSRRDANPTGCRLLPLNSTTSPNEEVIRDCHTERRKSRLAAQAAETGQSYEDLAMREFLTIRTQLAARLRRLMVTN